MIYIAHRGLIDGPDESRENRPDTIMEALNEGFNAEVDVWFKDDKWFLGHNEPQYRVDREFLSRTNLWLHCKNLEALNRVRHIIPFIEFFWHQNDDYTVTSNGFIWTYPGKPLTENSICVQPEWNSDISTWDEKCMGVCSKYVMQLKKNAK
jgi:hypothetical protein